MRAREPRIEIGGIARAHGIRGEVVIVTYGCTLTSAAPITISNEHKEVGLFSVPELGRLPMPEGYRASVRRWWELRHTGQGDN